MLAGVLETQIKSGTTPVVKQVNGDQSVCPMGAQQSGCTSVRRARRQPVIRPTPN